MSVPTLGDGGWQASDVWGTGLSFGTGQEYDTSKTPYTATTNAVDGMAPITSSGNGGGQLSSFWSGVSDVIKTAANYSIAKDAAKNGISYTPVQQVAGSQQGGAIRATRQQDPLLVLMIIGGLVYAATQG